MDLTRPKSILDLSLEQLLGWAERQEWSRAMRSCPQDPEYHAEGDVWTHTVRVCDAACSLDEWPLLSQSDQFALLLACLLHDVGKPATTTAVGERITSPRHAAVGAVMARQIMRESDVPILLRERVVSLVRYHAAPAFILRRDDPTLAAIDLSWRADPRLLHMLAHADARGREGKSTQEYADRIALSQTIFEESGCFAQPFPFANDHARFLFFRRELSSVHYTPWEKYSCEVTMLSGVPGSGKDHWCRTYGEDRPIVSLDAIRQEHGFSRTGDQGQVAQEAIRLARECLREGVDFLFNATNVRRSTRARWISLFHDYGARVRIVYLEAPLDVILERNAARQGIVPEPVIANLLDRTEVPDWTECHSLELPPC